MVCQGLLRSLGTRLAQPDPPRAKTSTPQTAVPVLLGHPEKEKDESERELAKVMMSGKPTPCEEDAGGPCIFSAFCSQSLVLSPAWKKDLDKREGWEVGDKKSGGPGAS